MTKKALLLHLPEDLFEIIKEFGKASGISYTNIIYNAIIWWLSSKGLLDLSYIKKKSKELTEKNESKK